MKNKKISFVLAVDSKNGLGKNNSLAWRIPGDMQFFKNITTETSDKSKKNAVIMGRKTWESIPEKFKPLDNRVNVILTKSPKNQNSENIIYFSTIESSINDLNQNNDIENIFVIGGANIYNQFLEKGLVDQIFLTQVFGDFECDAFFDGINGDFLLSESGDIKTENSIDYKFLVYKRK